MITALEIKNNVHDWKDLFNSFGIENEYLTGRHSPCPHCGGRDRFRYDNKHGNGDYFCNSCGAGDGLSLIQKVNNWDFATTAKKLIEYLGIEDKPQSQYKKSKYKQKKEWNEYSNAKMYCLSALAWWDNGGTPTEEGLKTVESKIKIFEEYEATHMHHGENGHTPHDSFLIFANYVYYNMKTKPPHLWRGIFKSLTENSKHDIEEVRSHVFNKLKEAGLV